MPEDRDPTFDDQSLDAFTADGRRDAAVRSRDRVNASRAVASSDLSMLEALTTLADDRCEVTLALRSGHVIRGRVEGIGGADGADAWVVIGGAAANLVRLAAVASLGVVGAGPSFVARRSRPAASFGAAFVALVEPGDPISLRMGATAIHGSVRWIGPDLVAIDRRPSEVVYVSLDAVDEVALSAAST